MARFDKTDPMSGLTRAALASGVTLAKDVPVGVSLNANGQIVLGSAGQSGFIGVVCPTVVPAAGDILDVMQNGDIVNVGLAAGTKYYADATTGAITSNSNSAANPRVGFTVEADRLVVRTELV